MAQHKPKVFVLDTNVLVHDPGAIFAFEKSHVVIPIVVLEELDKFKAETSNRGASTRAVIRELDALRGTGSLKEGVPLDNGATVNISFIEESKTKFPAWLNPEQNDDKILMTALLYQKQGYHVQFISKDLNARVKADVLGIEAHDYIRTDVSKETIFKGWTTVTVPAIELKRDVPDILRSLEKEGSLVPNQFVVIEARSNPFNNKVFRYNPENGLIPLVNHQLMWPIHPRNLQQAMALDLLLDPHIELVTLLGPAGTGKTFMALLAGLHQVLIGHSYNKMLISRPVIPLGPDIGYLPGTVEEKLRSWMQPIYDNMEFITHSATSLAPHPQPGQPPVYGTYSGKRNTRNKKHERSGNGHEHHKRENGRMVQSLDMLIKEGRVSLEAITYMRGRSIPFQYILIDEVQNLTPHEVKTLISRVGQGSKIILAGDPYQIDSPYLDFSSNGLVVASAKFKGQPLCGTIFLETSERSALSKLVSELL